MAQAVTQKVDVTRLRDAARTMVAVAHADVALAVRNRRIDAVVVTPRRSAAASAQAAGTGPDLAKILGIPLLGATVAFDAASAVGQIAGLVFIAASDVTFGIATQDFSIFQLAMDDLNRQVPNV